MLLTHRKRFIRASGEVIITLVVVATAIITGGVGLVILDAITCDFNVIFSSGCGDGGGGGGGTPGPGSPSFSPPPPQTPSIPAGNGFYAQPSIVQKGDSSNLNWSSSDATDCTITSNTGFTYTGGASGSVSTGAITESTTYTLTCQNGAGGPTASASVRVAVTPVYIEL